MAAPPSMTPEIERRVRLFVEDLTRTPWATKVRAVVIAGSAARGEEIWRDGTLISDVDVMVVTRSESLRLGSAISRLLARHSHNGLDGGRMPLRALRSYRTLALFEARERGVVMFGDPQILGRIPIAGPQDIPDWESVRLLLNRIFEHVRLAAGETSSTACVTKTYQALGEAQLALEGRYRPSFAERLEETRHRPLDSAVADLQDKYARSYEQRVGLRLTLPEQPDEAVADLRRLLGDCLPRVTGVVAPLADQLQILGQRERHIEQRLFWTAVRARQGRPSLRHFREDPVLDVWRSAIRFLDVRSGDPRALLDDWRRCPQIYRTPPEGHHQSA